MTVSTTAPQLFPEQATTRTGRRDRSVPEAAAAGTVAVSTPVEAAAQTPETAPEGTPHNARRLIGADGTGRAYVSANGARMRIESVDGRLAYTLPTVPDDAHQGARNGFAERARELAGEVAKRGEGAPQWDKHPLDMWAGEPQEFKKFGPAGYAPGAMLAWTVNGVSYTGQVWANRVQSGNWNGGRGETSAVVVATVGGRRARRDEAVCLPLMHGQKHAHAFVAAAHGNADAEVIAPQCAADGLFDVVTTAGDPLEGWEAEGGYAPTGLPAEPAGTDEPAPAETSGPGDAPAEVPAGEHCPRCDRNALYGIECAYCGHVIITALLRMVKPCHPPAWSEGCCPVCFTTDPEVWEVHGRLLCTVCAQGRSRWGDRVKAAPGWRERARRVVAWTDNPGELSYATAYADGTEERRTG
ncbi:hypothetical protein [Streptomyces europaeiscabiei]|uniref:hypothetical protein n=1 Tax=Streptomyces europaeiscabiei TaxID=146819 RepID=UPI0038F6FB38